MVAVAVRMDPPRSSIEAAVEKLRASVLAGADGAFLGSEDQLRAELGVSRGTVRQVARLLEREGFVQVRRGPGGGYFAARPDVNTIKTAVSAYLDTLDFEAEDVTVIASVLWVEVIRKASSLRTPQAKAVAEKFRKRVVALPRDASFLDVVRLEQESSAAIFDLINGRYFELIFQINMTFAQRRMHVPTEMGDPAAHLEFVKAWRDAKLMEFAAIGDGDPQLGVLAARHFRNLWHQRIWPFANS